MQRIHIDLDSRSYDIHIGPGILSELAALIPGGVEGRTVFIITDENVDTHAEAIQTALANAPRKCDILYLPAGEATKSFEQYQSVCEWLLENGIGRDSLIIAAGGGVIGDLAGFAAATIMRGVEFVQVPTTLLAQVDSSVGGKTGINTAQGKNLVGAFYQPKAVIIDTDVLKTLPGRELLAGYAEIVKYGLINDAAFFEWLEENGEKVCALEQEPLIHAIAKSVQAKAAIVQADETEQGMRALLNLGHTFGHALEGAAGYDGTLLHGEAVSIGMVMAYEASARLQLCPQETAPRIAAHMKKIGLPVKAPATLKATVDQLLQIMSRDKKASAGKLKFILARGIGEAFVTSDVPKDLVREILELSLRGTP